MNQHQKNRLALILGGLILLGLAAGLVLYALRQNISLFYTPTTAPRQPGHILRLGGYVARHSVQFDPSGKQVNFRVTDRHASIAVVFRGVLPSLFREGQGIVLTGRFLPDELFSADQVLAKHDEKYMPAPVRKMLNAA